MEVTTVGQSQQGGGFMGAVDPAENKEMFLQLLVAQLKNQDPLSPVDNKDFLAQMAQFSQVEQTANMVKVLESMQMNTLFMQGVSLIGKEVDYIDGNGMVVEGALVTGTTASSNGPILNLEDGGSIDVGSVVTVR